MNPTSSSVRPTSTATSTARISSSAVVNAGGLLGSLGGILGGVSSAAPIVSAVPVSSISSIAVASAVPSAISGGLVGGVVDPVVSPLSNGWVFEGCAANVNPTLLGGVLQTAPLGQVMDATVCETLCNLGTLLTPYNYFIIYDTQYCVCTATNLPVLQTNDCFTPCQGLLLGTTTEQCGAPAKAVYFRRAGSQVSGFLPL